MGSDPLEQQLKKANGALQRVSIRVKRSSLFLRATLPSKTGEGRKRYELRTGFPVTKQGIVLALAKAQDLQGDILLERFDWNKWGDGPPASTCGEAIKKLARQFERKGPSDSQRKNFRTDYLYACEFLDGDRALNERYLIEVIERETEPGTRSRQRFVRAYKRLCKVSDLDSDLTGLSEGYRPKKRKIPTDAEILEARELFKSRRWKWGYGILATYGLRPHELFLADYSRITDPPHFVIIPEETKTGSRAVLPLLSEWVELWDLTEVQTLRCKLDRPNKEIGRNASLAFKSAGIPFTPYGLRHAFAIRCSISGISPTLAAKAMGHSLSEHFRQYHRWLSEEDLRRGWKL